MAKITGLGGAFFDTLGEMESLLTWYKEVLGLKVTEYGINIQSNQHTLITLKKMSNDAYINFTVDNLDQYVKGLKQKGVTMIKEIKEYPYGKFCQIEDLHGNVIELFEIYKEAYEAMVSEEIANYEDNHNS